MPNKTFRRLRSSTVILLLFLHFYHRPDGVNAFLFGLGGGFGLGRGGCECCCPSSCSTTVLTTTTMCCRSCCGCCSSCAQQTFIQTRTTSCGCGGGGDCDGGCRGGSGCGGGFSRPASFNPIPLIGSAPAPTPGGCGTAPTAEQFLPYAQPSSPVIPYSQPSQAPLPVLPPLSPAPQLRPVTYALPQSQSYLSSLGALTPAHIVQPAPGSHGLVSGLDHSEALIVEKFETSPGKSGNKPKSKSKTKTTTLPPEESEGSEDRTTDSGDDEDMATNNDSTPTKKPSRRTTTTSEKSPTTTAAPKKSKGTAFDDLYDDDTIIPATSRNIFFDIGDISSENRKDVGDTLIDVFEKRSKFFENKKTHRQFSAPSIANGRLSAENKKIESLCNSYKLARIMTMVSDVSISKRLIRKATELSFADKKFDVFCAVGDFSYSIYAEQYCEATRGNITCFAFT